ncbi:hypothetical protein HMI54_015560, partial [Coelomomyces lativittatus]
LAYVPAWASVNPLQVEGNKAFKDSNGLDVAASGRSRYSSKNKNKYPRTGFSSTEINNFWIERYEVEVYGDLPCDN